jgi:hypothetical protein
VFISFFALFWSRHTHSSNHWVFNLFLPLQCAGFLLVFYTASIHSMVRRVNKRLLIVFPLATLACWLPGTPLNTINIPAVLCFDFLLLLAVCMAFVDLMLRTDDFHFIRQPMFWLASGLFFYSVENIIMDSTFEYTKKMVLFALYKFVAFSGDYLLDAGIIGCFICIYLERRTNKRDTDLRQSY